MCVLTVQHLVSVVVLLPNTEEPGQCMARRVCPTWSTEGRSPQQLPVRTARRLKQSWHENTCPMTRHSPPLKGELVSRASTKGECTKQSLDQKRNSKGQKNWSENNTESKKAKNKTQQCDGRNPVSPPHLPLGVLVAHLRARSSLSEQHQTSAIFSSLSLLLRPFPKPISKGQSILYRVQLVLSTSTFKSMMLFMG